MIPRDPDGITRKVADLRADLARISDAAVTGPGFMPHTERRIRSTRRRLEILERSRAYKNARIMLDRSPGRVYNGPMNNTTRYTSAAEDAKTIRTALKAAGISARQVSVRSSTYSMGSSISVRILDLSVDAALVREIATKCEYVRRDGYGEILSGGNRFVDVNFDDAAVAAVAPQVIADGHFRGVKVFKIAGGSSFFGEEWTSEAEFSARPFHLHTVIRNIAAMPRT